MQHDVFISYSSIDKSVTDTICSTLEQNGINCWIAPRDISPGVPFAEAIIDAIKESKVFILVYSTNSNQSSQVIKEVDRAVHHGLAILTLRLEDVPMSKQLEYYISDVHWLDALTPPVERHINQLSGVVKMLMSKDKVKNDDIEKAIRKGTLRLGKTGKSLTGTGRHKYPWGKTGITVAVIITVLVVALLLISPLLKQKISLSESAMDKSIAVLPFHNLSGDPEQDYFSEGMMDEILDRLFKVGDIKVISRTSSMLYKNSRLPLKEIAAELGVTAILEGSVRKAGNMVWITVQLIDARNDTHLWSEIYDDDMSDLSHIFSIQSEVAQSVARELKAVIAPEEIQLIEKIPTTDLTAYNAYLNGQFFLSKDTPKDFDRAMQYFELAIEKDPEFGLAYAGIARVWNSRKQAGLAKVSEATPKAEAAIKRALELDSTLSDVHRTLAGLRTWTRWDWKGGEESFRKAIELNPNNAEAHSAYSHLLNILGRPDEAMKHIETALELDPLNSRIRSFYGVNLMFVHRYDEAVKAFREALDLSPTQGIAVINIVNALYLGGREEEAIEMLRSRWKDNSVYLKAIDEGNAEMGFKGAMKKLAGLRAENTNITQVSQTSPAQYFTWAGDVDNALYWLEQAYEERDPNLPYLLIPVYDGLRDQPRFQEIARKMNLPYK
ncbi:MAG TPA: TIR domain-containing protein [Bacteroidales bacterium]|nr:MAG: Transcriptional regulator HilA [Bacteroidetes bacterium ADurb.Bin145]HOU02946.1 TIR domain-containing protein [Bacteroidales bacterium]HQK69054.1 TIR domain-containing protein [Bacteroidales bacterium]